MSAIEIKVAQTTPIDVSSSKPITIGISDIVVTDFSVNDGEVIDGILYLRRDHE